MKLFEILKDEWKEKPTSHKLIAFLGGIDVLIYMITPILLALIWISITGMVGFGSYLIYIIALLSTLFRAIKFWIKQ
jgi:hypothetical protein